MPAQVAAPVENFRAHRSGSQALHSDTPIGEIIAGPILKRTTPSEVEQKLLVPVLLPTGVPTTTYSSHFVLLHTAVMRNWYPVFVHHALAVQLAFPRVASITLAWSGDEWPGPRGSGPSVAKSRANPRCEFIVEYVTCATLAIRIVATALDSFAAILARSRLGIATAATTRTAPASNPELRLNSRIALSSPYAAITMGEVSTAV